MVNVGDELFSGLKRCGALGVAMLGLAAAGGCFTAQLEPDLVGVFVCDEDADEDDAACPSSLVCVNERCEDPDLVPSLLLTGPEDEEVIERSQVIEGGMPMGGMPGMIDIDVRIRGSLQLVSASAGADPTFGEGHVRISIDGGEPVTIEEGSINTPQLVTIPVLGVAGAHRIVAQAFRNDGEPYDNPEAMATRLFWLKSDLIDRPMVAIKSPWPGTVFSADDQKIDVEIATIGFDVIPPDGASLERRGHAHLYYDDRVRYPECVLDEDCRESYLDLADGPPDPLELPMAMEGSAVLTAVLANGDHTTYGFPFPCDPTLPLGPGDLCSPVFDAVEIVRVEED